MQALSLYPSNAHDLMLSFSDIDECKRRLDECGPLADCTNTIGSYTCACKEGYSGKDDGTSCEGRAELLTKPGQVIQS